MKLRLIFTLFILGFVWSSCRKTPEISTEMNDQFVFRNGDSDMPVFVHGNGASNVFILLLHGGPGDGSLKYRNHTFSNMLEKDYAIVYWDQRHQGNSHGHLDADEINIATMVEDTYLLIQTLKQRYGSDISLFLMGHSWGGTLGTAFMVHEDYQKEVKGWIESAGAHDFPLMNLEIIKMIQSIAPTEIAAGNHTNQWNEMLTYVNELDTTNISIQEASQLNEYGGISEKLIQTLAPKSESELSEMELFFFTPDNPATVIGNAAQLPESFFSEIISKSYTPELNKITTPTLLMWGKYDFKVPPAIAEKAFEEINTTEKFLKIYENAGHSSMRYQPTDFVKDVKTFIEAYK